MEEAWKALLAARPDRVYKDAAEKQNAREGVDRAQKVLKGEPEAACYIVARHHRQTRDDVERLMAATYLSVLDPRKGDPFMVWTMATLVSVDPAFDSVYRVARAMAGTRDPKRLPAVFAVLKAREGSIFLPLHSWTVNTQDCIYYVLSTYGRDVIPYLYPMLDHDDPFVRRNSALALGAFFDDAARPLLAAMLGREDIGAGGAAYALGELGAREAAPAVRSLLKSREPFNRFAAAYALYEFGDSSALPILEELLKTENVEMVREEFALTLEHLRRPKADTPGTRRLAPEEVRRALKEALDRNGLTNDQADAIAASADRADLPVLLQVRDATVKIDSDLGNKRFHAWREVIKEVRRRHP